MSDGVDGLVYLEERQKNLSRVKKLQRRSYYEGSETPEQYESRLAVERERFKKNYDKKTEEEKEMLRKKIESEMLTNEKAKLLIKSFGDC